MAYAHQLTQSLTNGGNTQSEHRLRTDHTLFENPETPASRSPCSSSASHRNSTSTCDSCAETPSPPRPTARAWAKKLVGRTKHHDPMAEQASKMSKRPSSSRTSSSSSNNWNVGQNPASAAHRSRSQNRPPGNLLPVSSPACGCSSSSDEGNSPTDLNSCKLIKDKPPLTKNLDVVQELTMMNESYCKNIGRPSSCCLIRSERNSLNSPPPMGATSNSGGKIEKLKAMPKAHRVKVKNRSSSASGHDAANSNDASCGNISRSSQSPSERRSPSCSSVCAEDSRTEVEPFGPDLHFKQSSRSSSPSSGLSLIPPPLPERFDSLITVLTEERMLKRASWFQAGIPREIALEILSEESIGSFMVRESTSKPGCFALSMRVPNHFHESGIAHYLIMKIHRGYKIKGFTKEFGTLTALITHHSVMPELLPCPLSMTKKMLKELGM